MTAKVCSLYFCVAKAPGSAVSAAVVQGAGSAALGDATEKLAKPLNNLSDI